MLCLPFPEEVVCKADVFTWPLVQEAYAAFGSEVRRLEQLEDQWFSLPYVLWRFQ